MIKILYIRFVILLSILVVTSVFCSPVLSDTFDDDFIKNKKLETSIDLKQGTELKNTLPENFDNNAKGDMSSPDNNPMSLPPVSVEEKTVQTNVELTSDESLSHNDGVPKPLYNNKKQILKPNNFYDNFVLDTASTKLPRTNQNNIFLLGLVSIVVVITSIFLFVNFLRVQKDLNKQRELFHKNFDPLNIRRGFFSADYDIRNAKADGIEIVKSQKSDFIESEDKDSLFEDRVIDSIKKDDLSVNDQQHQVVMASASEIPTTSEVTFVEKNLIPTAKEELSYQLKEANKVFEETLKSDVVMENVQKEEQEDVLSNDDLDFVDIINSSVQEEDIVIDVADDSFSDDKLLQEEVPSDLGAIGVANDNEHQVIEKNSINDGVDENIFSNFAPASNFLDQSSINENISDDTDDFEYNRQIDEKVPEIFSNEEVILAQEKINQPITEEIIPVKLENEPICKVIKEESITTNDVVFEQESNKPNNLISGNVQQEISVKVGTFEETDQSLIYKPTQNKTVLTNKEKSEKEAIVESEKIEEQIALEKFEVVDGYKLDENREILLIKEGNRYSFMVRIYKEVFKLFDMTQPDKINRIKEIDEKQGDRQVYMIKGEHHRILFAMNDKEANFIMEI